jgi:hypothetical protein
MRFVLSPFLAAIGAASMFGAGCSLPEPNDAEIGCAYDAQSSPQCPGYDAGVAPAPQDSGSNVAPDGATAGEGGASDAGSGLGTSCTSTASCAGLAADYCLVSPSGTFPSFCTFTRCTAGACGSDYACCDCSASPVSLVNVFPPGICVLPMTAAALPSYGCTCLPQGQ